MTTDPRIVLIGATGYTGRLIAAELARQPQPFVLAARDAERLKRVAAETGGSPQVVDVTDPGSLSRLIQTGDAVINTAGPFNRLGGPVVQACLHAGAHYLDTTGEQPWMRRLEEEHAADARARGVAVVAAMAFEFALGDCAAGLAAEGLDRPLRSVDVVYAWGGTAASAGTRRTAIGILGARALVRRNGELIRQAQGSRRRPVTLGSGRLLRAVRFGAGEVLTVPRWVEVEDVRGWLVVGRWTARVAPVIAPALPVLVPLVRPLLERVAGRGADPTPDERQASRFTIRVEAVGRTGRRSTVEVRGRDPYGLTAAIAVTGASRALAPDAPSGVLSPAQLIEPRRLLEELRGRGLEVVPVEEP